MSCRDNLKLTKSLFRELPYYGFNFLSYHGQFNNLLLDNLPTRRNLEKLTSIYDLDLFSLNTDSDINPDLNLAKPKLRSLYYSPHSFNKLKSNLFEPGRRDGNFSLLHNNIRSLKHNLDDFQVHLLEELQYRFSVIGITETKITDPDFLGFNPKIPGYLFEYVPTPLAAGGVGMYIDENFNYVVIEKTSEEAFQALWIEIQFKNHANVICGVIYRQHNSPERFQEYFAQTLI